MKVYGVYVRDWWGVYRLYSLHKTKEGAKAGVYKANEGYSTRSAYVEDIEVQE